MPTVEYVHIAVGADNVPMVAGTQIKVLEIAQDHLVHGWNADDIHREFPQLSLGQIHSALGYYYDHQEELDAEIQRRREMVEQLRVRMGDGPMTDILQAMRQPS